MPLHVHMYVGVSVCVCVGMFLCWFNFKTIFIVAVVVVISVKHCCCCTYVHTYTSYRFLCCSYSEHNKTKHILVDMKNVCDFVFSLLLEWNRKKILLPPADWLAKNQFACCHIMWVSECSKHVCASIGVARLERI